MSFEYCSDCKKANEETSEWRTFVNESNGNGPVCVGGPTNPLLTGGGFSTVISKPKGTQFDFVTVALGRIQNRGSSSDRALISAFRKISDFSDRLGLVTTVKDRANEIYKKIVSIKGRNQDAILAACIYVACKQEGKPRTLKEICKVATGATKKEIARAKEFIVKQIEMGPTMEMFTIHPDDLVGRYCSHLGLKYDTIKAVKAAVKRSSDLDIRRSPVSVAAAIIYLVTQLSEDKKSMKDISLVTGVAEGTIRYAYRDLHPYVAKLISPEFAKEEDLINLPKQIATEFAKLSLQKNNEGKN